MINDPTRQQLDRYLDGVLDAGERTAFEGRLSREPALREAMTSQQAIDAALRQSFAIPTINVATLIERAGPRPCEQSEPNPVGRIAPARRGWLRFAAVAAALLIAVVGGW